MMSDDGWIITPHIRGVDIEQVCPSIPLLKTVGKWRIEQLWRHDTFGEEWREIPVVKATEEVTPDMEPVSLKHDR